MFINPIVAIENGWITSPTHHSIEEWKIDKLISPNAIDFTLDKLFCLDPSSDRPYISNDKSKTKMRSQFELIPHDGVWNLDASRVYDGMSNLYVRLPEDVLCIPVATRSTLARNGTLLASGIYDVGYSGNVGFTVYTHGGSISIEQSTRVGQIAFIRADAAHQYEGFYNGSNGKHWTETTKKLN